MTAHTPRDVVLRCGSCQHYLGEPAALESALFGLNILSSAFGSVRDETGLCRLFDTFVVRTAACLAAADGEEACGAAAQR
jgi:hypothetical protein